MKKLLKIGLAIGFAICLVVSIPHLAWVFQSYERGDTTTLWFFWWRPSRAWVDAYLQAISIDGIIALVSLVLTNRKDTTSKGIGYTFVGSLIVLSWFFNWIYEKAHAPVGSVWNGTILHGAIHLSWITPIIASALPVFALAFTVMIDVLTGERMSATDLEEQLQEKAALDAVRKKYANDGSFIDGMKKRIDATVDIATYAKKAVSTPTTDSKQAVPTVTVPSTHKVDNLPYATPIPTAHDAAAWQATVHPVVGTDTDKETPDNFVRSFDTATDKDTDTKQAVPTPTVTVSTTDTDTKQTESTTDNRQRVLAYRLRHPEATQQEIAQALGISKRTVERHDVRQDTDRQTKRLRVVQ